MDPTDVLGSTVADANFEDHEFEEFVAFLLREENRLRHRGGDVLGPGPRNSADGGSDVTVQIRQAPKTSRDDFSSALTWDRTGTTLYSCKCTRGDKRWRQLVKTDARNDIVRKGKAPSERTKRPSNSVLHHLAAGHRFVIVTNQLAADETALLDTLADAYRWWMPHMGHTAPRTLREQLEVIDAHRLAGFIRAHGPVLPPPFADRLQLSAPERALNWDEWTQALREPPRFESDTIRDRISASVATTTTGSPRIIWIVGPPGTGKTRVVHHAVKSSDIEPSRVRYWDNVEPAQTALDSRWLKTVGNALVVVDEVRTLDVDRLVRNFLARAKPATRLVLIGTSDGDGDPPLPDEVQRYTLDSLADEATRRLLINELGAPDSSASESRIDQVVDLSGGFPLFAVLLAKALQEDEDSIEADSHAEREWEAAKRVLAGPHSRYPVYDDWTREAEIRAKCLLVVLLTHESSDSWDQIWTRHREDLAEAIDEPTHWDRVKKAARSCRDRQLLRDTGRAHLRYVSPRNLARIILNRFVGGDPDGCERLRRHVPTLFGGLHQLAQRLHASTEVKRRLAQAQWQGFLAATRQAAADAGKLDHRALYHATQAAPALAVRAMTELLDVEDSDQLLGNVAVQVALRGPIKHAVHRKLPKHLFARLEELLFRLSPLDDRQLSNGYRSLWTSIFQVVLDATHAPWDDRLQLLNNRLEATDPQVRVAAVQALAHAAEVHEYGNGTSGDDRVDGGWPGEELSESTVVQTKRSLWRRLIALGEDAQPQVAHASQHAIATGLRSNLGRGLFIDELRELLEASPGWDPKQRRDLAASVEEILCYDTEELAEASELLALLEDLKSSLAPVSYHERLLHHVGTHSPGPLDIADPKREEYERQRDSALIDEALADPDILLRQCDWLLSDSTARIHGFMRRLGQKDRSQRFLPRIVEAARAGRGLVPLDGYMIGWASHNDAAVEQWIRDHRSDPLLAGVVDSVLYRLPPTTARLDLLAQVAHETPPGPQHGLVPRFDRWIEALPAEAMIEFLDSVADLPYMGPIVVSAGARLLEEEIEPPQRTTLLRALAQGIRNWAADRIAMVSHRRWTRVAMGLMHSGHYEPVLDALAIAFDPTNGGYNLTVVREVLREAVTGLGPQQAWGEFAAPLLERINSKFPARYLKQAGLRDQIPDAEILHWVGQDPGRGRIAANLVEFAPERTDPLVVALLERFGEHGPVAAALSAAVMFLRWRGELAEAYRSRLQRITPLEDHPSASVAKWAGRVSADLRDAIEREDSAAKYRAIYATPGQ